MIWFVLEIYRIQWHPHPPPPLIARFMGPTWDPSGADRTQVGPMLALWTLLLGPHPSPPCTYVNVFAIRSCQVISRGCHRLRYLWESSPESYWQTGAHVYTVHKKIPASLIRSFMTFEYRFSIIYIVKLYFIGYCFCLRNHYFKSLIWNIFFSLFQTMMCLKGLHMI